MDNLPLTRDLVLIGGGHTHALVLRRWGMNPLPGVRVTVINPGPTAPYSGMLPGFVAGHYTRDDLDIDLVKLSRFAGARFINGYASAIDPIKKEITIPGRPVVAYDVAAIDVGITSAMPDMPGFTTHAVPAKPLGTFATRWDSFRDSASAPQIVVIGGGVAGAELAMAMAYALRSKDPKVKLIDRGRVLAALGYTARNKMLLALGSMNVEIIEEAEVSEVFPEGVVLNDGRTIRSDFTAGAAGAKPHDWIAQTGLDHEDGFIRVDANLMSSDPSVFAVGDCAHLIENPRPKAGVFAVRQAPVLYDNLRAVLSGGRVRKYTPQRDYLKLISLGGKSALAEKFGTARQGPLLWKLKDYIDVKFMTQFDRLPVMAQTKLPRTVALGVQQVLGDKPMCGGCGAKVGRASLRSVLGAAFGDDAAEVQLGQVMSTDHLRSFTHDFALMAKISANHALNDIWAMAAQPQAATVSITLPRMSADLQTRTLRELMETANDVMATAGAKIIGGHTSLGDELTIGFTVTGLAKVPVMLSGAKPGDALILTKPIGSGTIMAAEMEGKAKGDDVIKCLANMTLSQATASQILAQSHAMTDITGFGLAGHLRGLCDASGVGAKLDLDAIPIMEGARRLSDQGIRSILFDENREGAGDIHGPVFDLLFDPQTAGGLLAAVPETKADDVLKELRSESYPAVIIGKITETAVIETTAR